MANVHKINAEALRIPLCAGSPASLEDGSIWYDTTAGLFKKRENGVTTEIGSGGSVAAADVTYDNATSSLAATDVQGAIDEVEGRVDTVEAAASGAQTDIDDLVTLSGVAANSTHLGTFTGATIPDSSTVKAALQALETSLETKADSSVVTEIDGNVNDLITLSGVAENATHLGTFTGATIADSSTIKSALQDLETAVETKADSSVVTEIDGNVNDLITLSGVAENSVDLGTFTGSTISNSATIKSALQELETAVELRALDADVVKKAGSTMDSNADLTFQGGGEVLGLPATPSGATAAASKAYVDAVAVGAKAKQAVRVATTANITIATALNSGDTLDGVTLADGDRVLVKNQTAAETNGIYVVGATPARAADFDSLSPIDEINGAWVGVQEGTVNGGKVFIQYGTVTTIDTDPINFTYFNDLSALSGHDMIILSGGSISVDLASDAGLESSIPGDANGQLRVKLDGSTLARSASGLKVADAGITATQLATSVAGAGLAGGGGTALSVNVDASTIEIVTDTLQVKDGGITNAKVASGIDAVKIGAGTVDNTEFGYLNGVTSGIQGQINGKIGSLVEDTTPQLGGDLDFNGHFVGDQSDADGPSISLGASGAYTKTTYLDSVGLTASQTNNAGQAVLAFDHTVFGGQIIEYRIKEATTNRMRVGMLYITSNGTDTAITDSFTETGDVGVTWDLNISGSTTQVRYTTTANAKTMHCTVKRFLA